MTKAMTNYSKNDDRESDLEAALSLIWRDCTDPKPPSKKFKSEIEREIRSAVASLQLEWSWPSLPQPNQPGRSSKRVARPIGFSQGKASLERMQRHLKCLEIDTARFVDSTYGSPTPTHKVITTLMKERFKLAELRKLIMAHREEYEDRLRLARNPKGGPGTLDERIYGDPIGRFVGQIIEILVASKRVTLKKRPNRLSDIVGLLISAGVGQDNLPKDLRRRLARKLRNGGQREFPARLL